VSGDIFNNYYCRRREWWGHRWPRRPELYDLKGISIYRLSGELIGHLNDVHGSDKRLAVWRPSYSSVEAIATPDCAHLLNSSLMLVVSPYWKTLN
jgi:hypothetical protein